MIREVPVLVLIAQATCFGPCGSLSFAYAQSTPRHVGVLKLVVSAHLHAHGRDELT